jgi:hypothetical protein
MKWNVATDAGTDKETVSDIHDDDVCQYMILSPNVSTSTKKVQTIHYGEPNEKYVGMLHSGSKGVEMYISLELSKKVYAKSKDVFVIEGKRRVRIKSLTNKLRKSRREKFLMIPNHRMMIKKDPKLRLAEPWI